MSNQHVKRLKQVRLEREAAQEALDKSASHAQHNPTFYDSDFEDLRRAAENLGKTYYYRLTAELEGKLFRHLRDYHPSFSFDAKDGASDLANHCRSRVNPQKGDYIQNDLAEDVLAQLPQFQAAKIFENRSAGSVRSRLYSELGLDGF